MVLVHLPGFGMPLGLPVAFARPRISQALSGQYFALPLQRMKVLCSLNEWKASCMANRDAGYQRFRACILGLANCCLGEFKKNKVCLPDRTSLLVVYLSLFLAFHKAPAMSTWLEESGARGDI